MKRHFVPLGEIAEIMGGYAFKSSMMSSEPKEFQIIKMSNLYQGSLDLSRNPSFWESIDAKTERYILQSDDILMTLTGTVGKRDYGYTVQLRDEEKLLLNQRVCRIRPMHKKVDGFYLFQYLRTQEFLNKFFDCSIGGTGNQSNVGISDLRELDIYLPTISDQKAIANLLSTWDEAIEKTERMIQAKEKRFKWLLRELISDQCVEQNQGSEWKSCRLGKFIVERNEKSTAHDQHPVLTSSRKGLFYQSDYFSKQVTSSDNEGYKIVNKGDFTYRAMSDDGKFAFNRLDFCNHGIISPAYGVFYPKNINSDFLLFFMNSSAFFREVLKESQGGTRISLKLNAMKKILVSIPSIEKQNQIADTLTSAQREIDLLKKLADKYKTQKRGLMQKMLTGEWRVKPEIVNQYMEA